ncbi:P-loop containing nucleoside triphosphate hydrolase protein [Haematococcus lacustris]
MSGASAHQPVDIAFTQLSVDVLDKKSRTSKRILHGVSGVAEAGRLLAIMGASGAGKSTLLDVLAAQEQSSSGLQVSGQLLVNGRPRRLRDFARIRCYVQQTDVLLCSATVREAITTSALLKLPYSMPLDVKRAKVEEVIRELDLQGCADTVVGDELLDMKGISGGQKRRVSLGIELIKDPSVIFLDEPTSGLDSEMALSVMEGLVRLARKDRTVVCTIHQPNSDITALFDDLMLLAAGHLVYGGPWSGAVPWFERLGQRCPLYKNPTDFFMAVVRDLTVAERLWVAHDHKLGSKMPADSKAAGSDSLPSFPPTLSTDPANHLTHLATATTATTTTSTTTAASSWLRQPLSHTFQSGALKKKATARTNSFHGEPLQQQQQSATASQGQGPGRPAVPPYLALEVLSDGTEQGGGGAGPSPGAPSQGGAGSSLGPQGLVPQAKAAEGLVAVQSAGVPWWSQVGVLAQRNVRNWLRNPSMLTSELLQYGFISVFVGLMYLNSFTDDLAGGVTNRTACIWFAFAVLCFTPAYTTVAGWDTARQLLKRELSQRQYNVFTYYVARTIVVLPFQAAQCMLFTGVLYFFAGFQHDAAKFFIFYITLTLFQLVSEGLGLICAIVTRTATFAIIVLTFLLLLLLSFSGFLVTKIPVYFIWVNKASYLTYAFSALVTSEFDGLTFHDPTTGASVPGLQAIPSAIDNGLTLAQNVGILAAMVAGMEVLKLVALQLSYSMRLM